MDALLTKKRSKRPLFLQITFTALAFVMMVVLSYLCMGEVVHKHLVHNAENVLEFEQVKIEQVLQKPEAMLGTFSQTMRSMILRGDNMDTLRNYVTEITEYLMSNNGHMDESDGFYGYFQTLSGETAYINSTGWIPPADYVPQDRPWYVAATEAAGSIVATPPYVDMETGKPVFAFTRCLYDGNGRQLGIACLNVPISIIGDDIVATALSQGGYGVLVSHDMTILAHPNPGFVGRDFRDPTIPISVLAQDLQNGVEISERPMISFLGERSIAFFRELQNGWYLGLVTPKKPYFQSVTNMALILSLLGLVLAVVLISLLVQIDTERAKSSAESRQKSAFLANMSHEMRTPLNAIIGLSELTLDAGGLSEEANSNLEKIYNAGATLLSTVNDILDISKIEAGKLELVPTVYDIPSLVNDAITQSIMRIGEKPIRFSLDIEADLPMRLNGDDLRIKQLLNNLLSNAFKYTEEGSVELRIRCEREPPPGDTVWMTICVSDTGKGIPEKDMKNLFSDYTQVDTKTNRAIEGTGLGLSITKRIVEMMGGSISAQSKYGRGTTFTVRIRQGYVSDAVIGGEVVRNLRERRYSADKRNQNSRLNRVRLPYARVLVVDDVETNLDVAKGMMRLYGMQIDCAASGQEAVDAVRAEKVRYDAIFMDHMMPGMDGIEAARVIREEIGTEYAKTVPIIALTANAIVGNNEMFLGKGFQAFLPKPIEVSKLDAVLLQWVRNAEKERQLADNLIKVEGGEVLNTRSGEDRRQPSNRRGESDRPVFARTIDGLDIDKGMRRFGKDWRIYLKILYSFADSTRTLLEQAKGVSPDNLANYAITVHGIKGSSRSICADPVGDMAEALEHAAKAGDFDFVAANNPAFIAATEQLIADLGAMLAETENPKPRKDAPDREALDRLLAACTAFDIDKAEAVMEEIGSYDYESDDGLVPWLRENVNEANFSQIAERLSALPR